MKSVRLSSEQCSRVVGPLWPGAPPALETWEGYYGDQSVCLLDIKLSSPGSIWGLNQKQRPQLTVSFLRPRLPDTS